MCEINAGPNCFISREFNNPFARAILYILKEKHLRGPRRAGFEILLGTATLAWEYFNKE